jgi:hypothetical protein
MTFLFCRPPVKGGSEPQASGGLVLAFRQHPLDTFAHRLELLHHFGIGKADNAQAERRKRCCPCVVVVGARSREMTVAVDLDHEAQPGAIEIRDVGGERLLTRELLRQISEKLEPELAFSRRLLASQPINAPRPLWLTPKPTPRSPSARCPLDRGAAKA